MSRENDVIGWTIYGLLVWVAIAVMVAFCAPLVTSGAPDYCYVAEGTAGSRLMMHRPWRPDGLVQTVHSAKEAAEAAAALGCRMQGAK